MALTTVVSGQARGGGSEGKEQQVVWSRGEEGLSSTSASPTGKRLAPHLALRQAQSNTTGNLGQILFQIHSAQDRDLYSALQDYPT